MRDIKFRVKYGGVWCYINLNEGLTELGYKAYMECVLKKEKFYQYTGLKDKNGKEIYEGDIVLGRFILDDVEDQVFLSLTNKEKETQSKVFLIEDIFYIYTSQIPEDLEIIGNIHENQELLNK